MGTAMLRISRMLLEQRDVGLSKGHRAGRDSRNTNQAFAVLQIRNKSVKQLNRIY